MYVPKHPRRARGRPPGLAWEVVMRGLQVAGMLAFVAAGVIMVLGAGVLAWLILGDAG